MRTLSNERRETAFFKEHLQSTYGNGGPNGYRQKAFPLNQEKGKDACSNHSTQC